MPHGRRKNTGAMRMAENGYKQVQVWLDPAEYAAVVAAAVKDGRKVATWIRQTAVRAAGVDTPRA